MNASDFNGKTVAVVGNSDSIYSREDGPRIDEHDVVIRFNSKFPTRKNAKHLGSRTTHMSLVIRNGYEGMIEGRPDVEFYVPITIGELPGPMKELPKLPDYIGKKFRDVFGGGQLRPSSGALMLTYLITASRFKHISVFGFDGLQTGKHWHGHDKDAERKMLANLDSTANITVEKYGRRKIIDVGLPKTGTTSLQAALAAGGYKVKHGPYDISLMPPEEQKAELDKYDALLEICGLFPMKQLAEWYPDAIFVETVRESTSWHESCRKQFRRSRSQSVRRGRMKRFGINRYDQEKFQRFRDRCTAEVSELRASGVDIKVMDVIGGDGYEFLHDLTGEFAGMVGEPFPHKRKSRE